ncbi:hypothetical protein PROFUN_02824 [Planoprotostelium fungivorum]|uniref:Ras-GEF domain-containing protein n=1 Tax=Planoprotostelium fungivorum TaxID=1890364 RepID=A0A2P6NXU0_9EUKA|nr:hypothetical protein PROFUN_02824 [Planoprotostelium fungivorum]
MSPLGLHKVTKVLIVGPIDIKFITPRKFTRLVRSGQPQRRSGVTMETSRQDRKRSEGKMSASQFHIGLAPLKRSVSQQDKLVTPRKIGDRSPRFDGLSFQQKLQIWQQQQIRRFVEDSKLSRERLKIGEACDDSEEIQFEWSTPTYSSNSRRPSVSAESTPKLKSLSGTISRRLTTRSGSVLDLQKLEEPTTPIMKQLPINGTLESIIYWLIFLNDEGRIMNCFFQSSISFGVTCYEILKECLKFYEEFEATSWKRKRLLQFMFLWLETITSEELIAASRMQRQYKDNFINMLSEFCNRLHRDGLAYDAESLQSIIDGGELMRSATIEEQLLSDKVSSLMLSPLTLKSQKITPSVTACRLHSATLSIYTKIKVKLEFADAMWNDNDTKKIHSPNVTKMTDLFNRISYWVASEILSCKDKKSQKRTIIKFIETAVCCLEMNDFNDMMAIYAGLNLQCVNFFVRMLSPKRLSCLLPIEALMEPSGNFRTYRAEVTCRYGVTVLTQSQLARLSTMVNAGEYYPSHKYAMIPYLGLYLKDILFSIEGNPNFVTVQDRELINFRKVMILGSILTDVQLQQSSTLLHAQSGEPESQTSEFVRSMKVMSQAELQEASEKCRTWYN